MELQGKQEDKVDQSEKGFYCEVCDCIVKDSLNYLDHVNGKKHNKNLGISLKNFVDSTLEEVKEMLELKKRERDEKSSGFSLEDKSKDDDEKWRTMRREKKKRQKARKSGRYLDYGDDEDEDDSDDELDDEGEETDGDQDAMSKLMGFSSFSTSKK